MIENSARLRPSGRGLRPKMGRTQYVKISPDLQESIQWTDCSNGTLFKEDRDVWSCCNGRWWAILNPYFKINYHWSVSADYGLLGKDLWTFLNGPGSYVWFLDSITAIFSRNSIIGSTPHHRRVDTGMLLLHHPYHCGVTDLLTDFGIPFMGTKTYFHCEFYVHINVH